MFENKNDRTDEDWLPRSHRIVPDYPRNSVASATSFFFFFFFHFISYHHFLLWDLLFLAPCFFSPPHSFFLGFLFFFERTSNTPCESIELPLWTGSIGQVAQAQGITSSSLSIQADSVEQTFWEQSECV